MSDQNSQTVYYQLNLATLDLIDKSRSDFSYEIINFPDGQRNIVINPNRLKIGPHAFHKVMIVIRINKFSDLEILICSVKSLRNLGFKEIGLLCPYFLGSRSDKLFQEGSARYLKDVICPIINSLDLYSVNTLDPHSDVLENLINNFAFKDNSELIGFALSHVYNIKDKSENAEEKFILMSPDVNAYKKIFKVAQKLNINNLENAYKLRDVNSGEIIETIVLRQDFENKDVFIVDDICDKGRTVIELAKIIKTRNVRNLYLVVTHGIFSGGFSELYNHFNKIFCTNSYSDINNEDKFYIKSEREFTIPVKNTIDFVIQQKLF